MRRCLVFAALALLVFVLGASVAAQSRPAQGSPKTVVLVTAREVASPDGATLYQAYCASCHGRDLKGTGPAASFVRTTPPDLTLIAVRQPGTYCLGKVMHTLRHGHRTTHEPDISAEDLDMPNWAPVFDAMSSDRAVVTLRMLNIAKYVDSRQAPR